jgi:serine/threonine-protein kinase SRPK3
MIELLQQIPREVATRGEHAPAFFTTEGRLRHIRRLRHWPLDKVLVEKYGLPEDEVSEGES